MNKGIARRLLSVLLAAIMIAALLPAAGLGENVTAATALSITTQPVNATVEVGDTATFTVAASGSGTLSYQWQSRKDSSSTWSNSGQSGAKTKTLSVATTAGLHGWQFRCIVKDGSSQKTSNTVTLTVTPKITTQPTNAYAEPGKTATFTVAATGKAKLTYQWQSRKDASSAWSNSGQSGAKTNDGRPARLTVPLRGNRRQRTEDLLRCGAGIDQNRDPDTSEGYERDRRLHREIHGDGSGSGLIYLPVAVTPGRFVDMVEFGTERSEERDPVGSDDGRPAWLAVPLRRNRCKRTESIFERSHADHRAEDHEAAGGPGCDRRHGGNIYRGGDR